MVTSAVRTLLVLGTRIAIGRIAIGLSGVLLCLTEGTIAGAAELTTGPLVGGVTHDAAIVLVRTDSTARVTIRYSLNEELRGFSDSETVEASAISDFTAKVPLLRLAPNTRYHLDVVVDGSARLGPPYPSFMTFPPPHAAAAFRVLVLTDFIRRHKITTEATTFAHAAAEEARMLFIGGDFDHRESNTLEEFREVYREMYDPETPGLATFVREILSRLPVVHQYDDHDCGMNNADKTNPLKDLCLTAYREYVPHYPLVRPALGIWQSFRFAHVEFFVLDNRSQRDPNTDPDGPEKSMLDGDGISGQLDWLLEGLRASTAIWKVVFSSVALNPTTKLEDGWAPFMTERQVILDFVAANQITGVLVVSGDLHAGGIDDGSTSGLPEMVVPSPDLDDCLSSNAVGTWSAGDYGDNRGAPCRGYGILEFSRARNCVRLVVKDENGAERLSHTIRADRPPVPGHLPEFVDRFPCQRPPETDPPGWGKPRPPGHP